MSDQDTQVSTALHELPSINRRHLTQTFNSDYSGGPGGSPAGSLTSLKSADSGAGGGAAAKALRPNSTKHVKQKSQTYRNLPLAPGHETTFFDSKSWRESPAFGFWVLFWTVLGVQTMRRIIINVLGGRSPIASNILSIMHRGLWRTALVVLLMYGGMYVTYLVQVGVKRGYINWNGWGWKLQHLWQTFYIFFFLGIARLFDFPWISQIFLVLQNLTFLMKQHSYAMYNGHLNAVVAELRECERLVEVATDKAQLEEIKERIKFCRDELDIQSTKVRYPANVTPSNFFMYTMFPTVVYQLEYVRTARIRPGFLASKIAAVFGVLAMLIVLTEERLFPVAVEALKLRTLPLVDRLYYYPGILMSCITPFIGCYLLVFYLIWDAVLNCIAELTMFGDREFYRDWWNTVSWDQFARDWNVPVHNFLYRHVYRSSIATMHVSRFGATMITFLLSSLVHELTMWVIFDRVRGYLFCMQISQIGLTAFCRTKLIKNNPVLGMVIFWIGICIGPSILCSLYLII